MEKHVTKYTFGDRGFSIDIPADCEAKLFGLDLDRMTDHNRPKPLEDMTDNDLWKFCDDVLSETNCHECAFTGICGETAKYSPGVSCIQMCYGFTMVWLNNAAQPPVEIEDISDII